MTVNYTVVGVLLAVYYLVIKSGRMSWAGHVAHVGEEAFVQDFRGEP